MLYKNKKTGQLVEAVWYNGKNIDEVEQLLGYSPKITKLPPEPYVYENCLWVWEFGCKQMTPVYKPTYIVCDENRSIKLWNITKFDSSYNLVKEQISSLDDIKDFNDNSVEKAYYDEDKEVWIYYE